MSVEIAHHPASSWKPYCHGGETVENCDRECAMPTASATECTGAVPALTDAAGEANCRRLCDIKAAKKARKTLPKGQ